MPLFSGLRLVGGTALALQLGHRFSIDLDFFGAMETPASVIAEELRNRDLDVTIKYDTRAVKVFFINGIKTDIVSYKYDWLTIPLETEGVCMAQLPDIAAMKLAAITNRGTKKDFIDVYFLLQHFSFQEMLEFYQQKYTDGSIFNVIRSLSYFADAEADPIPRMFHPIDWETIKSFIRKEIQQF